MLKTTFIARASDGLILCETYDSQPTEQCKQAYHLPPSVLSLTWFLFSNAAEQLKINARELLTKSENFTKEVQCSVDIGDHKLQ